MDTLVTPNRDANSILLDKRYWMSDSTSKTCTECSLPFSVFRRRHHCRICGRIFCNKHAKNQVLVVDAATQRVRVCVGCTVTLQRGMKSLASSNHKSRKKQRIQLTLDTTNTSQQQQHQRAPVSAPGTPRIHSNSSSLRIGSSNRFFRSTNNTPPSSSIKSSSRPKSQRQTNMSSFAAAAAESTSSSSEVVSNAVDSTKRSTRSTNESCNNSMETWSKRSAPATSSPSYAHAVGGGECTASSISGQLSSMRRERSESNDLFHAVKSMVRASSSESKSQHEAQNELLATSNGNSGSGRKKPVLGMSRLASFVSSSRRMHSSRMNGSKKLITLKDILFANVERMNGTKALNTTTNNINTSSVGEISSALKKRHPSKAVSLTDVLNDVKVHATVSSSHTRAKSTSIEEVVRMNAMFTGRRAVDTLLLHGRCSNRSEAMLIGTEMLLANMLQQCGSKDGRVRSSFEDSDEVHYQFTQRTSKEGAEHDQEIASETASEITSGTTSGTTNREKHALLPQSSLKQASSVAEQNEITPSSSPLNAHHHRMRTLDMETSDTTTFVVNTHENDAILVVEKSIRKSKTAINRGARMRQKQKQNNNDDSSIATSRPSLINSTEDEQTRDVLTLNWSSIRRNDTSESIGSMPEEFRTSRLGSTSDPLLPEEHQNTNDLDDLDGWSSSDEHDGNIIGTMADTTSTTTVSSVESAPSQLTLGNSPTSKHQFSTRNIDGGTHTLHTNRWETVLGSIDRTLLDNETRYRSITHRNESELSQWIDKYLKQKVQEEIDVRQLNNFWVPIVEYLVQQTVAAVDPDCDANLSCSSYVVIEGISGGGMEECSFVDGLVFQKNVVRSSMLERFAKKNVSKNQFNQVNQVNQIDSRESSVTILDISEPTILLLGTALTFNPSANDALCSLDSLREGEQEYIRHQVNRILDHQPDIILCSAEVCRLAQNLLCKAKKPVAVLQQVPTSTMQRAARLLQTEIIHSTDVTRRHHCLGRCERFTLRRMRDNNNKDKIKKKKQTMNEKIDVQSSLKGTTVYAFIEGCPRGLGCSLVLRGGDHNELQQVRAVVREMIFRAYNWKLQSASMLDCFMSLENLNDDDFAIELNETSEHNKTSTEQTIKDSNGVMFDIMEHGIVALGTTIMRGQEQLKRPIIEEYRVHGASSTTSSTIKFPPPSEYGTMHGRDGIDKDMKEDDQDPDCSLGSYLLCRFDETKPKDAHDVLNEDMNSKMNKSMKMANNNNNNSNSNNKNNSYHFTTLNKTSAAHKPTKRNLFSHLSSRLSTRTHDNSSASQSSVNSSSTRPRSHMSFASTAGVTAKERERDVEHVVEEYFYYKHGRVRFRFEHVSGLPFPLDSTQLSTTPHVSLIQSSVLF